MTTIQRLALAALLACMAVGASAATLGDINGDSTVNVTDVTALINKILGSASYDDTVCDVNHDGAINVTDATSTINIILGTYEDPAEVKLVGGDISMLPRHEAAGAQYYGTAGQVTDMIAYYKSVGWNAMRVRLFVDPSKAPTSQQREGVVQDLAYVKALGRRIKQAGLKLVIDFHYSDTWADPSAQTMPSRWSSLTDPSQIADSVEAYTRQSLQALVAAGATPDYVQVGNEVTYGMLWPTGHCWPGGGNPDGGSWNNFARYLNAGSKAVRQVCPQAKVIVHVDLGSMSNATDFYATAKAHNVDYDIIGLSYYPAYHGTIPTLSAELSRLEHDYAEKPIMLMELGYSYAWAMGGTKYNLTNTYPYTEAGQASLVDDLVTNLTTQHAGVKGVFWWWPEHNEYGNSGTQVTTSWWNASLVDSRTGHIEQATYELSKFAQ